MRINRLDLTRYGHFTDRTLTFPRPAIGAPDLHVVYGPNEAGKSTLFSAWLDLLYGIEPRSVYGFLHPYASMRIGASLTLGGADALDIARIKTQSNSLLDGAGLPLQDGVITAAMGGLAREDYRMMFSLDEKTVEKGGESILSSQGDFGRLLFSASSGLAGLSPILEKLRADADRFHKAGGRSGRLRELKSELAGLAEDRRRLDIAAGDHARLVAAEKSTSLAHLAAEKALAETTAQLSATRRRIDALPKLARLQQTEADLAAMPVLPAIPSGWTEALSRLARDDADTAARIDEATKAIAEAEAALASLQPDPQGLDLAPRLEVAAALKSLHDTALADLPKRRQEIADADLTILTLLHRLGRPDAAPKDLRLPPGTTASLRAHLAEASGHAERLRTARQEAEHARQIAADAQSMRGAEEYSAVDTDALAALMSRLRAQDPAHALQRARQTLATSTAVLDVRLAALAPWNGSGAELAALSIPTRDQLDSLEARSVAADRALQMASVELSRLKASVEAVKARHIPPDTDAESTPEADHLRSRREALWAAHRKDLTALTADAFETAMRADDRATARLADQLAAAHLAQQASTAQAAERLALELAERAHAAAQATRDAALADLENTVHAISASLPPALSAPALREWLGHRLTAVEAHATQTAAEASCCLAMDDLAEARRALEALLPVTGADLPHDALVARAEGLLATAGQEKAARQATLSLVRREEALAAALAEDTKRKSDWARLLSPTWLDPSIALETLPDTLDLLEHLDRQMEARDALAHRVETMDANRAQFALIVESLSPEDASAALPPSDIWSRLTARLARARTTRDTHAGLTDTRSSLVEKRASLLAAHQSILAQLSEMERYFDVTGLAALATAFAQSAKRSDLEKVCTEGLRDIAETLGQADPSQSRLALEASDLNALDREAATLTEGQARQQAELQEAYATLSATRRDLAAIGGDDAVARIETRRQSLLLAIADEAEAHLRIRLGLTATEHALRTYRESHRSAMLERASAAFSTISFGAYVGLATQPDKDREQLVALSASGASKLAQDLSKGTRFQLYLALRVAGYFEYTLTRSPVPFIADDIMESFDDGRSARAFSVLSDMARVGQVIYLTHHEHLCAIAQATCPGVTLHRLG